MITEAAAVAAAVKVAAPLISREEHIAGEKVLQLAFKWGEPIVLKVAAIGWKRLRQISTWSQESKASHEDYVEAITAESLAAKGNPIVNFDHLDGMSMARLTSTALAFAFGEAKPESGGIPRTPNASRDSEANPPMPATDSPAPATDGSSIVGKQALPSFEPGGVQTC